MTSRSSVHELRVALRVEDFDAAVAFYRDTMGLPEEARYDNPDGRVSILTAGRATLELLSTDQIDVVDRIEAGRPVSTERVRLALHVADSTALADTLVAAGADRLGGPVLTPWSDRNVRLRAPDGIQLTLFTPEGAHGGASDDGAGDRGGADRAAIEQLVGRAIDLAVTNVADGQLPFGALAVEDGQVIATGVNTNVRDGDPTAHAETAAIRAAMHRTGRADLTGVTIVSSAQPCPMCVAVAALAGVERIVYAAPRATAEEYGFALPPAAARLGAAWSGDDMAQHASHDRAEEPFRAHAERAGTTRP
jgi:tRNA(Arg) A34 adenosine deaminase TadA